MENNNTVATKGQILLNEIIQAFYLDQELNKEQTDFLEQNYKVIEDFLKRPLNSPEDIKYKQVLLKTLLIARQRGVLPETIEKSLPVVMPNETTKEREDRIEATAETVAATVDEASERTKTDYKVGSGEMSSEDAIERMVDIGVAKAGVFIDKVVDKGINWLVTKGAVAVTTFFPPAAPVVAVACTIVKKVAPVIKSVVKNGVKFVAKAAVKVAAKVGKAVVSVAKSIGRGIKKVFKWIFD